MSTENNILEITNVTFGEPLFSGGPLLSEFYGSYIKQLDYEFETFTHKNRERII